MVHSHTLHNIIRYFLHQVLVFVEYRVRSEILGDMDADNPSF